MQVAGAGNPAERHVVPAVIHTANHPKPRGSTSGCSRTRIRKLPYFRIGLKIVKKGTTQFALSARCVWSVLQTNRRSLLKLLRISFLLKLGLPRARKTIIRFRQFSPRAAISRKLYNVQNQLSVFLPDCVPTEKIPEKIPSRCLLLYIVAQQVFAETSKSLHLLKSKPFQMHFSSKSHRHASTIVAFCWIIQNPAKKPYSYRGISQRTRSSQEKINNSEFNGLTSPPSVKNFTSTHFTTTENSSFSQRFTIFSHLSLIRPTAPSCCIPHKTVICANTNSARQTTPKKTDSPDKEKSFLRLSLSRTRNAPCSFSGSSSFFSASSRLILPKYHLQTEKHFQRRWASIGRFVCSAVT